MKTSNNGINLIKGAEGLRLKAYKAAPTEKYYTIGYGHYSKDITPITTITQEKAEELLPCTSGFFFGGVEYDEWYFKDLEDTIAIINSLNEEGDYYYKSSW